MLRERRRTGVAAAVLASFAILALAACGEDEPQAAEGTPSPPATTQPGAAQPPPAEPAAATATDPASEAAARELEAVVRAWSAALNAGDNEAAADLFARDALIVQAGVAVQLPDHAAAVKWNASLPCSGTIVDIDTDVGRGIVIAAFALGDRSTGPCNAAPGTLAAAAFLIENGKIAVWQQVAPPEDLAPERTANGRSGSAAAA
jgi:hypothetical protein